VSPPPLLLRFVQGLVVINGYANQVSNNPPISVLALSVYLHIFIYVTVPMAGDNACISVAHHLQ
jgi:hypothetical protein